MLSAFDKSLLNMLQTDLPIAKRPFAVLAERLGTEEAIVLERLTWLKENGYIRRIGPFFDSVALGYTGTLVAVNVEEEHLEAVAEKINEYVEITHNYERESEYNLWFTLLTPTLERQKEILDTIEKQKGVRRLLSLPTTKKFKISVQFKL
ncbi:MAG: AsnC family transcriptional regulator [Selenomonadales bacterium]|nr:AsnC family transcriptional regulator [Selenomonadales bacterium]MBQ6713215.1 AsnC family transcriptional regulator [Selenomonadales bacterium]